MLRLMSRQCYSSRGDNKTEGERRDALPVFHALGERFHIYNASSLAKPGMLQPPRGKTSPAGSAAGKGQATVNAYGKINISRYTCTYPTTLATW